MKRILFGKRAVKKPKVQEDCPSYSPGTLVLASYFKEKKDSLLFKLPNGKLGICYKEYIKEELQGYQGNLIKTFKKDLLLELVVLGERNNAYECTFFTQRTPQEQSLVAAIIKTKEEIGYTVEIGMPNKIAVLHTSTEYSIGELHLLQVKSVTSSTYILTDAIDREVYIGEKNEIAPGILIQGKVTGRPKYILGERKPSYTNLPYTYTAESLTACAPLLETRSTYEIDDEVQLIIVYVSEDRSIVHTIPYAEYLEQIESKLPNQSLIGQVFKGTVEKITDTYTVVALDGTVRGILKPEHYSDQSVATSLAPFKEEQEVQVRVYNIQGYNIILTAKESLLSAAIPAMPLEPGAVVMATVEKVLDRSILYSTFHGALITARRAEEKTKGQVEQLEIVKQGDAGAMYLGRTPTERLLHSRPTLSPSTHIRPLLTQAHKQSFVPKIYPPPSLESTAMHTLHTLDTPLTKEELAKRAIKRFSNGDIVSGVIKSIYQYGIFVRVARHAIVRVKISEISSRFVQDWQSLVHLNQKIKMVLYDIDYDIGRVEGSIKKYEVLNSIESLENNDPALVEPPITPAEPLIYAEEEEEASEEESEEDEELQMEIFNTKDSAAPWIKRIANSTPTRAINLYHKALSTIKSPESKKDLILATITFLSETPVQPHAYLPIIAEGVKREESVFLKKAIDNVRNSQNKQMYHDLCIQYIDLKRQAVFGYRELLYYAQKYNTHETLKEVSSMIKQSELKSTDKKEIEKLYVELLYKLSKEEGRTEIEKYISSTQNKNKAEWILKYINIELSQIHSASDIIYVRNLLERTTSNPILTQENIKNIFKSYLKFEKDYGTKEKEAKVLSMAKQFVENQCNVGEA